VCGCWFVYVCMCVYVCVLCVYVCVYLCLNEFFEMNMHIRDDNIKKILKKLVLFCINSLL
jgi:hypothetical protein